MWGYEDERPEQDEWGNPVEGEEPLKCIRCGGYTLSKWELIR
jgi:hypothetical protein